MPPMIFKLSKPLLLLNHKLTLLTKKKLLATMYMYDNDDFRHMFATKFTQRVTHRDDTPYRKRSNLYRSAFFLSIYIKIAKDLIVIISPRRFRVLF